MSILGSIFGGSPSAKDIVDEMEKRQQQRANQERMNLAFIEARKKDPTIIGVVGNINHGNFEFIRKKKE